jgi:hypothetical protein
MNVNFKNWVLVVGLFCFGLAACEKDIDIKLNDSANKIVIEGHIENGQPPYVILTNSLGYFSKLDFNALSSSFIHNAIITVNNGTVTHQLREWKIDTVGGAAFYIYTIDTANLSTAFFGELKKSYTLNILVNGNNYTAVTHIPDTLSIDSLWYQLPQQQPSDDSNVVQLKGRYKDPDTLGNYMRYYTGLGNVGTGLNDRYFAGFNSVWEDKFINGQTFDFNIDKGVDRNKDFEIKDFNFHAGDTVTIKWSAIDRAHFDFWQTLEFSLQSVGNPFSSPTRVLGNIPGALGIWGGYGTSYKRIIIPQ